MSPDVILGVMSAGGFVHMGFFICRGFCPQGVLSWIPFTYSRAIFLMCTVNEMLRMNIHVILTING